ncbi:MAG: hypothetical protein ACPGWR_24910 [Ardenticatenaceae bacterium]
MSVKKIVQSKFAWLGAMLLGIAFLFVMFAPIMVQAVSSLPAPPPVRDARFGIVQAYNAPEVATAAGVGWTRVLFWWHQMQIGGPHDWNPYYFKDEVLKEELESGRKMVGIVLGTAGWASESGSDRAVPDGLYLPYDHPDNHWGQFVYRIVKKYEGKIDHWIMWNEPDVWDDEHPGKTWNGTVDDYVQLLKVGYQAAKAANKDAVVFLTATTYWWDVEYGRELYLPGLLEAIRDHPDAVEYDYFFDVASLHLYFKPEQIYKITKLYRDLLDRYGFPHKPLWINETNAPPSNDPKHPAPEVRFHVTQEQQSYFLIQAWAMGLAGGAEQIAFYKMRDEHGLPEGAWPYGMVRKDGSLRPVFWSFRTLVTYLSGYEAAILISKEDTRRVVVWRGELGTTNVVWNMGQSTQTVDVPATSDQALLVDAFGPIQTIRPTNGYYTLSLSPSQDGHIGGMPLMVVEGAGIHVKLERPNGPDIPMVAVTPSASPTRVRPSASPTRVRPSVSSTPVRVENPISRQTRVPRETPIQLKTPLPLKTAGPLKTAVPLETAGPRKTAVTPVETPFLEPPIDSLRNWSIPNGHFFTQTSFGNKSGFSVIDDEDARFWSEYQRLGGLETVGYPISQRYERHGFVTQAFQKLILQWRPQNGRASPINLFDEFSQAGLDKTLRERWQIPLPLSYDEINARSDSWKDIVEARQALLDSDPAIRARYFAQPNPITAFGLPTSRAKDMGTYTALRTQRAVFQHWKNVIPSENESQVTIANGGSIAKELGWLPAEALKPIPAPPKEQNSK